MFDGEEEQSGEKKRHPNLIESFTCFNAQIEHEEKELVVRSRLKRIETNDYTDKVNGEEMKIEPPALCSASDVYLSTLLYKQTVIHRAMHQNKQSFSSHT